MSEALYLDASALAKLVLDEPESPSLRSLVGRTDRLFMSVVGEIETRRAVMRTTTNSRALGVALDDALARVNLVPLTEQIAATAAQIGPPVLRTLDAIHLATALAMGVEVDALAVYDRRLANAALARGLVVVAP